MKRERLLELGKLCRNLGITEADLLALYTDGKGDGWFCEKVSGNVTSCTIELYASTMLRLKHGQKVHIIPVNQK